MYAEQRGGRYLPVRAAVVETFVHQLQHDHAVAVSDNHLGHNVISEAWEHAPIPKSWRGTHLHQRFSEEHFSAA